MWCRWAALALGCLVPFVSGAESAFFVDAGIAPNQVTEQRFTFLPESVEVSDSAKDKDRGLACMQPNEFYRSEGAAGRNPVMNSARLVPDHPSRLAAVLLRSPLGRQLT
jgi:hypothetical protein